MKRKSFFRRLFERLFGINKENKNNNENNKHSVKEYELDRLIDDNEQSEVLEDGYHVSYSGILKINTNRQDVRNVQKRKITRVKNNQQEIFTPYGWEKVVHYSHTKVIDKRVYEVLNNGILVDFSTRFKYRDINGKLELINPYKEETANSEQKIFDREIHFRKNVIMQKRKIIDGQEYFLTPYGWHNVDVLKSKDVKSVKLEEPNGSKIPLGEFIDTGKGYFLNPENGMIVQNINGKYEIVDPAFAKIVSGKFCKVLPNNKYEEFSTGLVYEIVNGKMSKVESIVETISKESLTEYNKEKQIHNSIISQEKSNQKPKVCNQIFEDQINCKGE